MTVEGRLVSLSHLTMIEVPPVELVHAAGSAGYDAVGLRFVPTSDGVDHGVLGNRAALVEVARALADEGIRVLDIEVVRIRADGAGEVRPLLEAGAQLEARHVICTVEDDDRSRRLDNFAAFCGLAASFGLTPNLEYMLFTAVHTLAEAVDLVIAAGAEATVLIDALHHARSSGTPDDLQGVPLSLLPYVQICDAATPGPAPDAATARSEAVRARMLPGTGRLDLPALMAELDLRTALAVEAPTIGGRRPDDPTEAARAALAATARLLGEPPNRVGSPRLAGT